MDPAMMHMMGGLGLSNPQGFARALPAGTDLVEHFFESLPAPSSDYLSLSIPMMGCPLTRKFDQELGVFLSASEVFTSQTADHKHLVKLAKMCSISGALGGPFDVAQFQARLAHLALSKTIPNDDTSFKAQHLRYFRWVVRGRKDEESPFKTPGPSIDHAILPNSSNVAPCAACGKIGASMRACTACKFLTEGSVTFATLYCDKVCQTAHWKQHKGCCKALRRVYRAMSIFEQIYPLCAEMAADPCASPQKILEEDGMLKVHLPSITDDLAFGYRGTHILVKVPDVPGASKEQKIASLMVGHCAEMVASTKKLFEYLLQHSHGRVETVVAHLKNVHRPVYIMKGPAIEGLDISSLWAHTLFRVTLPGGKQVAVDITRQQFGWKEFVSPWDEYVKHRVQNLPIPPRRQEISAHPTLPAPVDSLKTAFDQLKVFDGAPDEQNRRAREMTAAWVASALEHQITNKFGGLEALLALGDGDFALARESIVAKANTMLLDNITAFERLQDHKLYVTPDLMATRVALGKDLCQKLRNVWFTEEEYKRHKNSPSILGSIWLSRWHKVI